MGEVVSLRLHRLMKEDGMTKEQAQRYLGYIEFKIAHKRAMDERDRLKGQITKSLDAEPNRKRTESESVIKGLVARQIEEP